MRKQTYTIYQIIINKMCKLTITLSMYVPQKHTNCNNCYK